MAQKCGTNPAAVGRGIPGGCRICFMPLVFYIKREGISENAFTLDVKKYINTVSIFKKYPTIILTIIPL